MTRARWRRLDAFESAGTEITRQRQCQFALLLGTLQLAQIRQDVTARGPGHHLGALLPHPGRRGGPARVSSIAPRRSF